MCGSNVFLGVTHAPTARGRCLSAPQFLGSHSIYAHTLWRRTTEFDVATYMARGLFLGVSHAPTPRARGPSAPKFYGFLSICAYTIYCKKLNTLPLSLHVGSFIYRCVNNQTLGYFCSVFSKNIDYHSYDNYWCRLSLRKESGILVPNCGILSL